VLLSLAKAQPAPINSNNIIRLKIRTFFERDIFTTSTFLILLICEIDSIYGPFNDLKSDFFFRITSFRNNVGACAEDD
jgi:hypothetical protein